VNNADILLGWKNGSNCFLVPTVRI